MKKTLPAFLLAIAGFSALAQNYDYSIFKGRHIENHAKGHATVARVKEVFPGWAAITDNISGSPTDIYGAAIPIEGSTYTDKAAYCINSKLNAFDINKAEWHVTKAYSSPKANFVNYEQIVKGHKVVFAKLNFRFTNDGRLQRVVIRNYGSPKNIPTVSAITKSKAVETFTTGIKNLTIKSSKVDADWSWFPVPGKNGYELRPAWHVQVDGKAKEASTPLELDGYIDAISYKLLYRTNGVKDAFDVTVKGNVYKTDILTPSTQEPLPYLQVQAGSNTYNADNVGLLSLPSISGLSASYSLNGLWAQVIDYPSSATPTYAQTLSGTGNTFIMTSPTQHNSAYYHVHKVHDFMKGYFPSFTQLDFPLEVYVDVTTGFCNAYFSGSQGSLNFYAAGGGCNSLAETPDVVYHEYGHAINLAFYYDITFTPMMNSALNEAYADIWGLSITKQPKNGRGAFTNVQGGGCFRRYDKLPKLYPEDIMGEPHADGEIMAGSWWDVGINFGNVADMTRLFSETYFDVPDGPDGTEGQVYHDVLVSALLNDDNDANLSNGTPRFTQITKAFAKHGIYLLGEVLVAHNELANQKSGQAITVNANISIQDPTHFKGANLHYKVRGTSTWNILAMTNSGSSFTAQIPAQPSGTLLDYYFAVTTLSSIQNGGAPLTYDPVAPIDGGTIPYQFGVGFITKDSNQFEGPLTNWNVGAPGDNASDGLWVQAVPIASYTMGGAICQPEGDHTTQVSKCLVTANAFLSTDDLGQEDVDNGITTVLSPVFDLSAFSDPVIEYYRWYTNSRGGGVNAGNDQWIVQVGNAGSNWHYVDSTYRSDHKWRKRIFAVKEYLTSTNNVQLRLIAGDRIDDSSRNQGQSVVEAAFDDLFIYDKEPVGIDKVTASKASVYPNPADGKVYITFKNVVSGDMGLYDATGKLLLAQQLNNQKTEYHINTSALAGGIYHLMIRTQGSIQSTAISVVHK